MKSTQVRCLLVKVDDTAWAKVTGILDDEAFESIFLTLIGEHRYNLVPVIKRSIITQMKTNQWKIYNGK